MHLFNASVSAAGSFYVNGKVGSDAFQAAGGG